MIDLNEMERIRILAYRRYFGKLERLPFENVSEKYNLALECYVNLLDRYYKKYLGERIESLPLDVNDRRILYEDLLGIGRTRLGLNL